MADAASRPIPPLLNQQLRLLIDQICAVTGTWPITVELGVLAMAIGYLAEVDQEALAELLELESSILRDPSVPRRMTDRHDALIARMLDSWRLKMSAAQGSA